MWTQPPTHIVEVDRISTNIPINCFERGEIPGVLNIGGLFWIINNSVYGVLHVPRVFTVCSERMCDLKTLVIPLALREMNGSRFQCVYISYQRHISILGRYTDLTVVTAPFTCEFIKQQTSKGLLTGFG